MRTIKALEAKLFASLGLTLLVSGLHAQQTELLGLPCPEDPLVDNFVYGSRVSLSGDWLFVADPSAHDSALTISGVVYAYTRTAARWDLVQSMSGVDTSTFGQQLCVDGDTAAISSPSWFRNGSSMGRVELFRLEDGGWQLEQQLYPAGMSVCDDALFGMSLALSGDVLAIRMRDCPLTPYHRRLRIYEREEGVWRQTAQYRARPTPQHAWLGQGLAADEDLIVAGLDGIVGSALVLRKGPQGWFRSAWLSDASSQPGDDVGHSVAIDGGTVVVGAPVVDSVPGPRSGSAIIFERAGVDQWNQVQRIRPSDPFVGADFGDGFGFDVAIDGDEIAVGANHGQTAGFDTGAVYYFRKGPNGWPATETERFVSSTASRGDWLGTSVDIQDGLVVSGVLGLGALGVSSTLFFGQARGDAFCQTVPNSTGLGATLSIHGNDVPEEGGPTHYLARNLPSGATGGLAASLHPRVERSVFNGNLCLGPSTRLIGPVSQASADGRVLDELRSSELGSSWLSGSTLYFQYWHSDLIGQGLGFSNAVEWTLQ